jgi:hypothetical protein
MGFFGMLFWIAVLWLVIKWWRRSERCVTVGPGGYPSGWPGRDQHRDARVAERTRPEARQEYIDLLESRVSDLEERLDFTERLLASRNQVSSQA